jgi:flagellar basal body-associated protein FliL
MKLNSKLVALAVAAVVVTAGAVGAVSMVSAQTPAQTPTTAPTANAKDDFLSKFAANLGVTVDQVKTAGKSAADSTVDDLVAQGKLTQDRATRIKEKIDGGRGLGFGRFMERRKAARAANVREGIAKSAATAIGIDVSELRTAFQNGSSIADVAAENGASVDTVKTQITNDAKAKLDAALQNGKITQTQEDNLLQKLAAKLDEIVNKKKS